MAVTLTLNMVQSSVDECAEIAVIVAGQLRKGFTSGIEVEHATGHGFDWTLRGEPDGPSLDDLDEGDGIAAAIGLGGPEPEDWLDRGGMLDG
jgi:hypothetical protein